MRPNATGVAWWYLRVSGLLVVALVLGHLFVMHYANAPSSTTSSFVLIRWSNAFWRDFDWALLLLALTHGLVGMRNVIADAVPSRIGRRASEGILAILAAVFPAVGTLSIVSVSHGLQTRGILSGAAWIVPALDALLGALAIATYLAIAAIIAAFVARALLQLPIGWWQFHGQWAWALHRATGIGIFFFLIVHVLDLTLLPLAPNLYDATVASYANPFLMPMEIALVCAVIYHALNGIRLWVLEFFDQQTSNAAAGTFACVVIVTLALVLPSIFVLVRGS
ncbi:MAG TPA: succinate dehydrogenase, cytochrome b556 subunit [Candidatus Acidoferrales bacterium]|nr:succinate dehydrogenase, cytochrome b556 subunit [Candidatus Acidoferrales bacterium]